MNNPFTLSFGKKPLQYVSRISQTQKILELFNALEPSNQRPASKSGCKIIQPAGNAHTFSAG